MSLWRCASWASIRWYNYSNIIQMRKRQYVREKKLLPPTPCLDAWDFMDFLVPFLFAISSMSHLHYQTAWSAYAGKPHRHRPVLHWVVGYMITTVCKPCVIQVNFFFQYLIINYYSGLTLSVISWKCKLHLKEKFNMLRNIAICFIRES